MQNRNPTGTVTFLFTDIEGSTRLWEAHPNEMEHAFRIQEGILRNAIEAHNGYAYKMIGDAFQAAFQTASKAAAAAIEAQRALEDASWPSNCEIRVRMALHTGETEERGDDYVGPLLNRAARLLAAGHGGQVLLTQATQALLQDRLPAGAQTVDLGEGRLKDLIRPERIYQLTADGLPAEFPPLNTLDRFRHNLPLQRTYFIGREEEIAAVENALAKDRLVTLTGPGGIGKTRLSLQTAANLLDAFPDGVWFIELASIADPELVLKTTLNTLGLREDPSRPALQVLTDFLGSKESLLVLDNCEHLVEASAAFAENLLPACPRLKMMATSRQGLGVTGERVIEIQALSIPAQSRTPGKEQMLESDAVRLFVERAGAALPGFSINEGNAAAIVELCRRLDGIPLAIELAAARVRILQVEEIADRLEDSMKLLSGRSRTALPHQKTMRTLIDWSYDLLEAEEQQLFARLSVFAGGWTLEAAESACAGEGIERGDVLDLLSQLVGKSLVVGLREPGREARLRFLEPIRQYAVDKLTGSGEREILWKRHMDHYLSLAVTADALLRTAEQGTWFQKLEREHDNLIAALDRSLRAPHLAESGLQLAGHLGWFWYARGYLRAGQRWLERLVEIAEPDWDAGTRALGLRSLALLHAVQGDLGSAQDRIEQSLKIYGQVDNSRGAISARIAAGVIGYFRRTDPAATRAILESCLAVSQPAGYQWETGEALHMLGHVASLEEDFDAAREYFAESVQILRALGDDFSLSHPLNDLGRSAQLRGDLETARSIAEESLEISGRLGFVWGMALAYTDLGKTAFSQGDYSEAERYLQESLNLSVDVGDKLRIIEGLSYLGFNAAARDDPEKCVRLLGAVDSIREHLDYPFSPVEREVFSGQLDSIRKRLEPQAFDLLWNEGHGFSIDGATALALSGP